MRWVKCTAVEGGDIYVNVEQATTMRWVEKDKRTFVAFAGDDQSYVTVKEQPAEIIRGATI